MAKKIIVTLEQANKIKDMLKAGGKLSAEDLCNSIMTEAGVDYKCAELFVTSWRWNHKDEPAPTDEMVAHVVTPLFKPARTKTPCLDSQSKGVCAEIRALAEQGKSVQEILAMNHYSPSTVRRQYGEWAKAKAESKAKRTQVTA